MKNPKPNGDKTAFPIDSAVSRADTFSVGDPDSEEDLITLAITDNGISASGRAEAIIKLSQVLFDKNIEHDVMQLPGAGVTVGILTASTNLPSIMYNKVASCLRPV